MSGRSARVISSPIQTCIRSFLRSQHGWGRGRPAVKRRPCIKDSSSRSTIIAPVSSGGSKATGRGRVMSVTSPDIPGDDIFQFNAYVGYRFRRNYGDITLGFLNMTDQDYKLNPLNYYNELPRERTLSRGSVSISDAAAPGVSLAPYDRCRLPPRDRDWLRLFRYSFAEPLARQLRPPVFADNLDTHEIVLVYLDEESAKQLHQPIDDIWNRALHVPLLDRLTRRARASSSMTSSSTPIA